MKEKITIEICYKSAFNDYWLLCKEALNDTTVIQKLDNPEYPLPSDEMFNS